jgi:perosamine synthetase
MMYIIGIGSHAEVVYSIVSTQKSIPESIELKFLSYPSRLNDNEYKNLNQFIKDNYVGGLDEFSKENAQFIIGIGDNIKRKEIATEYKQLNYVNAIHPKAQISTNVKIGFGNVVCAGVVIQTGTIIGNHNIINTNSSIDHHNKIDNFCHIAPNCALCGNIVINNGVFIGVGSSIVPKISLKAWSFIKANSLIKKSTSPIQMYEPYLDKYKASAMNAINSGWISSLGEYIDLASNKLKEVLNAKYVILTNNGTSATHCLFLALKYKYPLINKIYVPNNIYVAAWNCALMEYNEDQVEVMKIDIASWNIVTEEQYILSLDTNSAMLVVHNIGNIINVPKLKRIRPDIIFIEDNCEGLFGRYENVYTGCSEATLCSSISFFGNKTITSGEGGAILCSDQNIYEYLKKVCNQGNTNKRYIHDVLGYNYRMTNIEAAFIYDQLCDIKHILDLKKGIFNNYELLLKNLLMNGKVQLQKVEDSVERAHWMFGIKIINNGSFEKIQKYMNECGVEIRPMFYPINAHKHLHNIKIDNDDNEQAIILNRECIMIPSYPSLEFDEQKHIIECMESYINNL